MPYRWTMYRVFNTVIKFFKNIITVKHITNYKNGVTLLIFNRIKYVKHYEKES